jgi:transcriptional regulator with XRE-family HTH domain
MIRHPFLIGNDQTSCCLSGKQSAYCPGMYGRILRELRLSKRRGQADVARAVGISPAQLARLETNQRGLYIEDFVSIAEALGEKPGNLLPNDLGDIGRLKPLIDRLASVKPEFLARVSGVVDKVVLLTEDVASVRRVSGASEPATRKETSSKKASRKARR